MKNIFESILDLIYRKKCYFCGKSKHSLIMCPQCYEKLEFSNRTANRIICGSNIFCSGIYTKELQKLIRGLKYHGKKELAYYQAKFMYDYMQEIEELRNKDFILIPVPLHKKRILKRKYNHMELVCEELAKLGNYKYNFNLIKRIKNTKPQYKLSRQERLENLKDAFEVDETSVSNVNLLLIDDICTTGSTFEEMINALKKAGFKNITCFATATPV